MGMIKKLIGVIMLIVLIGIGSWYYVGYAKYELLYLDGTEYAGVSIGGLTKEEAIKKVEDEIGENKLTVKEYGEDKLAIKYKDVIESIELGQGLEDLFNSQDKRVWFLGSQEEDKGVLTANIKVSHYEVGNQLRNNCLTNKTRTLPKDAKIEYHEGEGFKIIEEEQGDSFNEDELILAIEEGIKNRKGVNVEDYYEQPTILKDDEELKGRLAEIKEMVSSGIKIRINEEDVEIPQEKIESWVLLNKDGTLDLDYDLIYTYVEELNDQYRTYGKVLDFDSTLQGGVEVQPGTYGWSFDIDLTTTYIYQGILNKEPVIIPEIIGTGINEDWSDYVEVDLEYQKMFIYKGHDLVLETDIVSGQTGSETIPGAYAVWNKELDAVLVGFNVQYQRDYQQPVSYWIPFDDTGQGIHDANWQSSFGGDTYLYSGSQGCINTPPAVMVDVFNLVDVGMPVIIF